MWPIREKNEAVPVAVERRTSTHIIELTEDGVVCIRRNEFRDISKDPEILRKTEGIPNYNVLDRETLEALLSFATPLLKASAKAS